MRSHQVPIFRGDLSYWVGRRDGAAALGDKRDLKISGALVSQQLLPDLERKALRQSRGNGISDLLLGGAQ